MNVILIPPSDKELEETVNYYNDQMPGLGEQFYDAFLNTVNYIKIVPDAWSYYVIKSFSSINS